ncbi:acyl-CoA dehydrogenase family protein [Streptomyces paromomycinus]|uniref:Acyl-CoA dehydrogenase n=1 Tax=Streptomyces paromomycinus TaxID=92743 RepID=A0A401VWN5_STREY|nr:acyl-CoA dehydrogenase family protein [Streptomyces paromomycinus]GCD41483.1 acyl-CoA dehydrogenase [Streptomyces paromomycinus]
MRFLLDDEQREFGRTLGRMLATADTPAAVRAWGAGNRGPGRTVWRRLGEAGVFGLAVPEKYGGSGFLPVELVVAYVEAGRHAVPGPLVETAAAAVLLDRLGDAGATGGRLPAVTAEDWLPAVAAGDAMVSYADLARGPYALDAAAADAAFAVSGDTLWRPGRGGAAQPSVDPARLLSRCTVDGGDVLASGPAVRDAAAYAADTARLLTAAQALGVGRRLLDDTVAYVGQRTQFGVAIGSFQAVKHRLADVLVALEFAGPLVLGAAVELAGGTADGGEGPAGAGTGIAMAKVAASEAAHAAARAALQLHGALGYTDELDLSLWIRKARALRGAWGTPAECRARVLASPAPGR